MKVFRSKITGAAIHFYRIGDTWFYKHCPQHKWLKKQLEYGPFKSEGHALLHACQNPKFNFNDYSEVRRNNEPKRETVPAASAGA